MAPKSLQRWWYHLYVVFYTFFPPWRTSWTFRTKGWAEWAFPEVEALSFWPPAFLGGLSLSTRAFSHPAVARESSGCFQGGEVLRVVAALPEQLIWPTLRGSELPLSLKEKRWPRWMVPADPQRPRSVSWERTTDTKPLMDGRAKHPGPSLSATPNLLERLPPPNPSSVKSLNCILNIFPEAVTKNMRSCCWLLAKF